jgi:hypothetical protein
MQDDDIWELDAIELLVGHLESNPDTAVAIGNSAYIEDTGKIWQIFTFEKQGLLTLIFGEKAPFIWMGLWRTNLLRQFDYPIGEQHGKDIIIAAESVLSHPYGYVNTDKILYFKTIYHEKARAYIKAKPFCHFEMYSTLIYRVATSKHVKNKLIVFVLIPVSCLAIVRLYAAQILFLLPVEHPVRKSVRWAFRQIGR